MHLLCYLAVVCNMTPPCSLVVGTNTWQEPSVSILCMFLWKITAFQNTYFNTHFHSFIHSFIHSIGMCRMRQFLAVLKSFFHSSLLYTLSFHPFPPTSLPSSLTSSCHLLFGLPLSLVASKFIYNTFFGIQFSSILCTCTNRCVLFNLIVSVIVGFLTIA